MSERVYLDGRLRILQGDIGNCEVDAIVNAANSSLLGGGGVDGMIHSRGGPKILEECRRIRNTSHPKGLPAGEAVFTTAGELPARYVIHTVGPIWHGGDRDEDRILASCYTNSLRLANRLKVKTIAAPAISTGIYGFPMRRAAGIALRTISSIVAQMEMPNHVWLVLYSQPDWEIWIAEAEETISGDASERERRR